ncbi:FUSC family protein [Nakamurella sp. GG22]
MDASSSADRHSRRANRKAFGAVQNWSRRGVNRVRSRGRPAFFRTVRMTAATVAAYLVALILLPDTVPVIAALTALLVVEVTLFDIVTSGVQRVVSVVAGVMLAVWFSSFVDITWWSLGILVAASIMIGQILRLGPHLVEVPISAMLVLGVGGAEGPASNRIVETLIGAAVGVAVNVLFPPAIRSDTAAKAVQKFAAEICKLLETSAAKMTDGITVEEASRWLEEARRLNRHAARIDRAVVQAEQSRKLNARALTHKHAEGSLRSGLDSLEHTSVALRTMFRSIVDGVREHPDDSHSDVRELRTVFAVLLFELGAAVNAYGALIRAEVEESTVAEEAAAVAALDTLREARVRVTELHLVDVREDMVTWELNDAILEAVERVLRELDVEEQARRRATRRANLPDPRSVLRHAHERFKGTARHIGEQPLRWHSH